MPTIDDYQELDLTYLNVDHATSVRSILRADYGDGYADTAIVGAPGGRKIFTLSAGVWPDDINLATVGGKSAMAYYWDFFEEHLDNGNYPFIIEWRGRKWLVDVAEPKQGVETLTSDLFVPDGIELRMRRVSGLTHALDGSLFDWSFIESSIWGRYRNAQNFPTSLPGPVGDAWENEVDGGGGPLAIGGTDVVKVADQLGTHDAVRFSGTTNDGFLTDLGATGPAPKLYEAFVVMKMREATFSNNGGILSAGVTITGLVGQSGTTKFFDLGEGDDYRYKKNNVSYANDDMQAPMNAFGVVHVRFMIGKFFELLQIGKDRDFAGRFAEVDIVEIVLCKQLLDDLDSEAGSRALMNFYEIS